MNQRREHAIVLGASVAGLAAARVLAEHFQKVTLVERDALEAEDTSVSRKGVPQGNHGHGILTRGYRLLDEYFPGLVNELVAAGAQRADTTGDFLWYQFGGWKLRADSGLEGVVTSRPLLEVGMRRRVRSLPNIELLGNHDAVEPCFDAANARVRGLRVRNRGSARERELDADLVVDSTGRGSHAPRWLSDRGFGQVVESVANVDVGYSTAFFERRPGDLYGAKGAMIASTPPASTRSCAILGVEGGRWQVTLVGALRDYPPTRLSDFRRYARSLPTPEVYELIADREPQSPFYQYRFPANRRLYYERLPKFPEGFLLVGDALCCFNPMYGQGVTVAMIQAQALDQSLHLGDDRLAPRFLRSAGELIDTPWTITTGEDLRYAKHAAPRPLGTAVLHRYLEWVHRAARHDPVVLRRFFEVVTMLAKPSSMLTPGMLWRVLVGNRRRPARTPRLLGPECAGSEVLLSDTAS
jgi:2-polyprenyl-6-methoxyphenol hydroxylase-like FAD-dependent oxidoreductase